MKKKGVKTIMKKKLLLIIGVLTLTLSFLLTVPRTKAASDFDDTAHYIGFIEDYERDSNGYIIGAWVFILDTSLPAGTFPRYVFFNPAYFQMDILVLQDDIRGANNKLIWNPFDNRASGGDYNGAWWLLIGYEYISDNIGDAYEYGYESGYINGYTDGERVGYNNGYDIGYEEGELQGWEDGYEVGYTDGHNDGYNEGFDDAYSEITTSEEYELGYDNGFKDGEKSKIVKNNEAFYGGIEKWLVPAIIVVIVLGGIFSIASFKRREV